MAIGNQVVVIISAVGFAGTFANFLYYSIRAFLNKTGPMFAGTDKQMKNYSGHYEHDMLPVFINLVTALQYFGELIEDAQLQFGFFNKFRYGSYLITCPLMVYEICYTVGSPYSVSIPILVFFTILVAIIADTASTSITRFSWFSIGIILNGMFFVMLYRLKKHADILNHLIRANTDIKALQREVKVDGFPNGVVQIRTPMDDKYKSIETAFYLMFFLWPIFPLTFCLEYSGCIQRNDTQFIYALTDLFLKTAHSYYLDDYKHGLCQTFIPYGFMDTSILYELDLSGENKDIYTQLKSFSRAIYGSNIIDDTGSIKNELDYQTMLISNRFNRKVDEFVPPIETEHSDSMSSQSFRLRTIRSKRSLSQILPNTEDKEPEVVIWH